MTKFAQVGDFCPDETCPDYGKRQSDQQHNIIKYGKTKAGRQRYKCQTCGATFTGTKGTIFYRRRTSEDEIIETLALIAEGNRISSLARAKGHKEDTIIDWVREAGQHAEAIEEAAVRVPSDTWANRRLVGLRGQQGREKTIPRLTKADSSLAFCQDRLAFYHAGHGYSIACRTWDCQDRDRSID
jgi:transposase-like protein